MSDTGNGDLRKQLVQSYSLKFSDLRRAYAILIGFGLFFILLVLVPYYSIDQWSTNNKGTIANLTNYTSSFMKKIDAFKNDSQTTLGWITNISNDTNRALESIESYNTTLRDLALLSIIHSNIESESKSTLVETITNKLDDIQKFPDCQERLTATNGTIQIIGLATKDWIDCNLDNMKNQTKPRIEGELSNLLFFLRQLNRTENETRSNLTQTIKNITSIQTDTASPKVKELSNKVLALLLSMRLEPFRENISNLTDSYKNIYEQYRDRDILDTSKFETLTVNLTGLSRQLEDIHTELDRLKQEMESLISEAELALDEIETGFEGIELPVLGSLPVVRFDEIITLFPVSLTLGFIGCSILAVRTMRARLLLDIAYDGICIKNKKNKKIEITKYAPLWMDPQKDDFGGTVALFVSPILVMFIISVAMTFSIVESQSQNVFQIVNTDLYAVLMSVQAFIIFLASIVWIGLGYSLYKNEIVNQVSKQ